MKTILMPVDFQGDASGNFKYIERIFKDEEIKLELIYVADPAQKVAHDSIQDDFRKLEATVLKGSKISYSFSIAQGNIVEELQSAINRFNPFLLMIGVQGTRLVKSLVKLVDCPLYIIPQGSEIAEVKNILYAHDFNAIQESSVLQPLRTLATAHHAKVNVLHITRDDSFTEDKGEGPLEYYLDRIPHEYASVISNDFVSAINGYINKHQMDLLVLLLREHGQNATNSKGELVEQLLTQSNIPVLILV
jgi:hypothetical protein